MNKTSSPITYTTRPEATPEAESDALAACYRLILACHERNKAAPASRPDAPKENLDASDNVSISR